MISHDGSPEVQRCVCACVCARARMRAYVHACVRVCAIVCPYYAVCNRPVPVLMMPPSFRYFVPENIRYEILRQNCVHWIRPLFAGWSTVYTEKNDVVLFSFASGWLILTVSHENRDTVNYILQARNLRKLRKRAFRKSTNFRKTKHPNFYAYNCYAKCRTCMHMAVRCACSLHTC